MNKKAPTLEPMLSPPNTNLLTPIQSIKETPGIIIPITKPEDPTPFKVDQENHSIPIETTNRIKTLASNQSKEIYLKSNATSAKSLDIMPINVLMLENLVPTFRNKRNQPT